jgi:phosphoglucomutase
MNDFFGVYGRNYFSRYDYEECESAAAENVMKVLKDHVEKKDLIGKEYAENWKITTFDNFEYVDPVDKSVSKNQGIRIIFNDNSRIIFRLSGTGSVGATVRIYFEKYEATKVDADVPLALKELIRIALEISQLKQFIGREDPTVIT